jgi:hypothetical protein
MQHIDDADYKPSDRGQFVREITDLAADVPLFDLVICDEAHLHAEPAAATSKLGTALGGAAGALLLVSATPVNNTNKDLFTLLRLLDADFFENEKLFHALLEENRPAVQTLNALTALPPQIAAARIHADVLAGSSFVGKSELLERLRESLGTLNAEDASTLIAAQEMAEGLNILGSYVTRTRRAQVKEKQPVRDPLLSVELTPTERNFMAPLQRWFDESCAGGRRSPLSSRNAQQRMESCIPAMVQAYKSGQLGDVEELLSESFDFEDEDLDRDEEEPPAESLADLLRQFQDYDFEANDSKYEKLREQLLNPLGGQKVIIFSYFKGTLFYLERRLRDGVPLPNRVAS